MKINLDKQLIIEGMFDFDTKSFGKFGAAKPSSHHLSSIKHGFKNKDEHYIKSIKDFGSDISDNIKEGLDKINPFS